METIFKEGQNVKDKVFRRGKRGIVRLVSKNKFRDYVLVDFENSASALYTFDGILIDIDGNFIDSNPTLSIDNTTYVSKEDFNKIPTVDDAIIWLKEENKLCEVEINYDKEFYTSEEMYNAFEALKDLIFLRDYYNENWQPDWNDNYNEMKWIIHINNNKITTDYIYSINKILCFKTMEIRDKFLNDQRKLIEIAKPLL